MSLPVRVHAIASIAEDVRLLELRPASGLLPAFEPGAHVDVTLPNGLVRSYSLLNDSSERHRYLLGVRRDRASRGGSAWIHDSLRVDEELTISPPRNNFPLEHSAARSVLIAGGIGITPLWSMVQTLERLARPWILHYGARGRDSAALLEDIERLARDSRVGHAQVSFERLDLRSIVRDAGDDTHLYCCGPTAMLDAFQFACEGLPPERVHLEYFAPRADESAVGQGFTVVLARSNRRVWVAKDQTILAALRAEGLSLPSSCEQGVCGTCETAVLDGIPDHRDLVLSAKERAANKLMMICCSRSSSETLVLDI